MAKVKYQVTSTTEAGKSGTTVELRALGPTEGEQNGAPKSQGVIKLVGLENEAAADFTLGALFTVEISKA